MQINSSRSGLYPTVLPATRRSASAEPANADIKSTSDVRSLQPIAPPTAASSVSSEASRAALLSRQRAGFDVLSGIVQISQSGNEAVARRAVAEYSSVATQERRFESAEVLVGIDVFA